MIQSDHYPLIMDDGHQVMVRQWRSSSGAPPRGVVHVIHGMSEHVARYEELAQAFASRGIVVIGEDHRGHGTTETQGRGEGGGGRLGHAADKDSWERICKDLGALHRHIRDSFGDGIPVFVLGHSMGSFLALKQLVELSRDLGGVILSGGGLSSQVAWQFGRGVAAMERWRLGGKATSSLLQASIFGSFNKKVRNPTTEFDWLSRDPNEVAAYLADPLCGFPISTQFWFDFFGGLIDIHDHEFLNPVRPGFPIFVISGHEDPVGRYGQGVRALVARLQSRLGAASVNWKIFPRARHELFHELEEDRRQAINLVVDWVSERLSG